MSSLFEATHIAALAGPPDERLGVADHLITGQAELTKRRLIALASVGRPLMREGWDLLAHPIYTAAAQTLHSYPEVAHALLLKIFQETSRVHDPIVVAAWLSAMRPPQTIRF